MGNISFSPFTLPSDSKMNRHHLLLNEPSKLGGVYLRWNLHNSQEYGYAEYYPHTELGDLSVDEFLSTFHLQRTTSQQKTLHFLHKDLNYQMAPSFPIFYNHIFESIPRIVSSVFKIKLGYPDDLEKINAFHNLSHYVLRLDANGLFTKDSYQSFRLSIHPEVTSHIEYIEDPSNSTDWSWVDLPCAQDFITPALACLAPYYIYKPNRSFFEQVPGHASKVIFSSYQGSDLGRWHVYQELSKFGDLSVPHGIITAQPSSTADDLFCYNRETSITYHNNQVLLPQYCANEKSVKSLYQKLQVRNWDYLCTI